MIVRELFYGPEEDCEVKKRRRSCSWRATTYTASRSNSACTSRTVGPERPRQHVPPEWVGQLEFMWKENHDKGGAGHPVLYFLRPPEVMRCQ